MKKTTRHGRQKKVSKVVKLVKAATTELQNSVLVINERFISALATTMNADLLVKLVDQFSKRKIT